VHHYLPGSIPIFSISKTLVFIERLNFWVPLKYFHKFPQHFARDEVDSNP